MSEHQSLADRIIDKCSTCRHLRGCQISIFDDIDKCEFYEEAAR